MTDLRRDRQRLEISREAIRLFRVQGVAATSGEQIAGAVGLSARTLWRYFRSKEACVEPVLSLTSAAFVEVLRSWPTGVPLERHIATALMFPASGLAADDVEATLAVVQMSTTDPVLRAIWLVVHERAEPVLGQVLADRARADPNDLDVRVRAAALSAAVRITMEIVAAHASGGTRDDPSFDPRTVLAAAVRAATGGAATR